MNDVTNGVLSLYLSHTQTCTCIRTHRSGSTSIRFIPIQLSIKKWLLLQVPPLYLSPSCSSYQLLFLSPHLWIVLPLFLIIFAFLAETGLSEGQVTSWFSNARNNARNRHSNLSLQNRGDFDVETY